MDYCHYIRKWGGPFTGVLPTWVDENILKDKNG
jgi:hypothetical protein